MRKSIFLFFAAILCATNAWAGPTFKGGCVYFHNKGGWNDSYKYICISHDGWTEPRSVTVITNTQLWYNALPTSGWTDAKYMSAMGHSSSKSASNFKVSSCNHYTKNVSLGDWGFNSGNAQMLTPANGNNNAALELTYMGNSYSSMNRTITVKAKVSTDNGSSFAEATSPGTLSASSFAFTSYTSCKSAKTLSSGKITCGYTANTSLTAADADGYIFAGWYDASGNKQTEELTLSLNPTADATYYAYYTRKALAEETHDVTVSYMCGATSIKAFTTASGVGVSTASEITAPVIAGYNFSNWTLGSGVQSADANANPISITTKASGDYTLTANYTEIPKTTVYFVNNKNWSKVNVYGWEGSKGENPGWPGADITANKLAEKIGEYDVYSYTVEQGSYGKVIFNDGSSQTADYIWTDGNYYWYDSNIKKEDNFAGGTKEDVTKAVAPDPLATEVYLAGDMTNKDNWDVNKKEFKKATAEATTASVTVTLAAQTYKFKLVVGGAWKGNTGTMQRGGDAVHEGGWSFDKDGYDDNCQIVADIAGDYTFTWNLETKKLTVTYPPLPTYQVTTTANPAAGGTVSGTNGDYEKGSIASFTANANDGYKFVNWTKAGKEVSTESTYSLIVTETVELVANFELKTYTVKFLNYDGAVLQSSTVNHGETPVYSGKTPERPADAQYTYTFSGWDNAIAAATGDQTYKAQFNTTVNQYTITVNTENGTVTGAGTYNHGATVTLNATADFDYNFVNWTVDGVEVSTEATYTFTIEADVELVANFDEVQGTTVAESGVFTIGKNKTAVFATGNLQYKKDGENETWRFAKQQYQVVGEQNIELGHPEFTGWIDMLGWSTNNEGNNFGVNPNNVNELYDGEFVDWGTKMGAEWSTLSADDWKYLLITRANAAALKQVARVGEMVGILLFPDVWTMPEGCTVEAEKDEYFNVNIYNYTIAQWNEMEATGAVFLPAAGRRTGGYGNKINYDQVEENNEEMLNGGYYRHQDNTNIYCYYWTSTINDETKNVSYLHNIVALGNEMYTIGTGAVWGEKGRYGQSVRLAKVTEKYEVTATAENGTVTGAGVYEEGTQVTLTAIADFDYEFVNWTKGEEVVSTENPYTFNITEDVELTANFAEVAGTSVAETGVFTIGEHKTATFATGNLQYKKDGENETWRFAKQQYQVVGAQNIELGNPEFKGWIDMLGWSNGDANNWGVNPSNSNADYAGEFVDWGTKMGAEWSTLSADDWKYLLNERANAAALKQVARVGEMVGILLFPDVWTMPEGCTVETAYNEYYETELYNYTLAQWAKMEAEGAMFLPAAGRRTGGWGNTAVSEQFVGKPEGVLDSEGHYKHFDNFNDYCYYWTSTINEETKNVSYLHNIVALGNDEYTIGTGAIWSEKGRYGQSVRLAKVTEVPSTYTVSVTAENGTVTGLENEGVYEAGATATLTATANKGYHFVNWTVAGGTISTEATLDYVVNANVEIVANFHATTILVQPGEAKLNAAVQAAHAGDTLVLVTGEYEEPWSYDYNKEGLVVMAAEGAKPVIALTGEYTALNVSASTTFDGITFDGTNVAKYIIATLDSVEMDAELTITNCEFKNWTLWAISNQYANNVSVRSVVIDNCLFHDGTGAAISFSNNAPEGKQACEYFEMTNSTLYKISESSYRGIINVGSNPEAEGDYNTVVIDHITMYDYTLIESGIAAIAIRKTHNLRISNSIIANPEDNGYTALNVYGGTVDNTIHYNGAIRSGSTVYTKCDNTDPMFVDAANGNFALASDSPARGKATDGSDLGDPRWYTALVKYNVTATANPVEAGTITGAGEYAEGKEVTLVATPERGYKFVNWTVEGEEVSTSATYTFTPTADVELIANFEETAFLGNVINVEPGKGTLMEAVAEAEAGDKLVLTTGNYEIGYQGGGHLLNKEGLIITAAEGEQPVVLYTDAGAYLKVEASITFEGIVFDGGESKPSFLITTYGVAVESIDVYNCEFKNYTHFAISDEWSKGCHIGSLIIDDCLFHDGGSAVCFSKNGLNGENPCDYFEMKNTTIYDITETEYKGVIHICSLNDAESDATNTVVIDHVTIYNYNLVNGSGAIVIRKTHDLTITNTIVANPEVQKPAFYIYGGSIMNTIYFNADKDSDASYDNCSNENPLFADAANGNFNLLEGSPAIGAATDGTNLGDTRWVVSAPVPTTYKVTLTINEPTYGSVTGLKNEGVYEEGEEVTLIVAPGTGYELFYWTIDEEDIEGLTYTFTITKDVEIYVFFKATQGEGGNTGTNLDNILVGEKAAKVIIDGKLVIIKNGKAYNAMGQEI